jgi:TonB-linked SusC/RagA family outer membrane protein
MNFSPQLKWYMKITLLFYFVLALSVPLLHASPGYAQSLSKSISGNYKGLTLQAAIYDLQRQTNVDFGFTKELKLEELRVNGGQFAKVSLGQALTQLLGPHDIQFKELTGAIILSPKQQPGTITGRVFDEQGQPLIGAGVRVMELGRSTSTDIKGNFSVTVPPGTYTIEVSYISFETQRKSNILVEEAKNLTIDVVLKVAEGALNEVVVTALGISREKKQLGYSVQQVKGSEFEKASDVNMINSLQGKVAGLKINTAQEMFISSSISLRGENPIIVVDGVSTKVGFWELNQNDIESISVLKSGVAAALYGAEGRNGAIIVTTKRGHLNKTAIEVNSTTSLQPGLLTYPKTQTTFGSGNGGVYQYVNGTGAGLEGGGFTWGPKLDGRLLPQWNSPIDALTGNRTPIPWVDKTNGEGNLVAFLETGFSSVNNINLESGSDKGMFRASISHSYQKGIVPNTNLNITGFSAGGNYKVKDWYTINTALNYSKQYSPNYRTPGYGSQDYFYSLAFWLGSDIDLNDAKNYWADGKTNELQRFQQLGYYNNPYLIVYENKHTYDKNVLFGQVVNNIRIIPNALDLIVRTGVNSNGLARLETIPKSMLYGGVKSQGDFIVNSSSFFRINTDVMLTYKKNLGKFFDIDALVGYATTYEIDQGLTARTNGMNIPGLYTLKNSINPVINNNSKNEQRIDGLYANLNLKIWKPFYLSLTARNDWVSTLPVSNNKFLYPSASLAYIVNDMVNLPSWVDLLKFRGSWSQVNSGWTGSTYGHIPVYNIGSYNGLASMEMGNVLLPNDLMPSGTRMTEYGGEMMFLKNRLGLDFTFYNRTDYDNIISMPVSEASGYGSIKGNANEYDRRGTEITFNARPVQGKISWNTALNWSKSHQYLNKLENNKDRDGFIRVGSRLDQQYLIRWLRDNQGQVIYNNTTGLPIRDTYRRYVGNSDSDFQFGFQNQVNYKNFGLNVSLEGQKGGLYQSILPRMKRAGTSADLDLKLRDDAANGLRTFVGQGVVVTGGAVSYDFEGTITNDTRTFASNTKNTSYEDWVKTYYNLSGSQEESYLDASYLKLRDVSLSYAIPSPLLRKTGFTSVTVSFVGNNLWILTKKESKGDDPSWFTGNTLKSPTPVSYGLNLNLKF